MEYRHIVAKVRAQAARKYRRQSNFGNEHHSRAAKVERCAHCSYINLGLAAACDAVQEESLEFAGRERFSDLFQSRVLRSCKVKAQIVGKSRVGQRIAPDVADIHFQQASF